jgi:8-oxo-dGTP pyrophosphatase MutT (NUDIX family)
MDSQVAVKAVIRNKGGKYLIVREDKTWQGVGGRLQSGESLEAGLRRETEEETGIADLEVGKVIHVDEWFAKPEGELKHIVAIFFLCKTGTSEIRLSDEHNDFAWVSVDDLETYGDTIKKEIYEAIILADMISD